MLITQANLAHVRHPAILSGASPLAVIRVADLFAIDLGVKCAVVRKKRAAADFYHSSLPASPCFLLLFIFLCPSLYCVLCC